MDLLQNDPQTWAGGTSYAAGWSGYKRENQGQTPANNYVNLFDSPYQPGSVAERPAIYCGDAGEELRDSRDGPSIGNTEHRILRVPLVLAVMSDKAYQARRMRSQLKFNVRKVLYGHMIENGFWYQCWEDSDTASQRDTGGGEQGVVQSIAKLYFVFQYTRTPSGTTA